MEQLDVKDVFDRVLVEEPPFEPDFRRVLGATRRSGHRRLVLRTGMAMSLTAVATALALTMLPSDQMGSPRAEGVERRISLLSLMTNRAESRSSGPQSVASSGAALEDELEAIRANSPDGLTFDLHGQETDWDQDGAAEGWFFDGNVDDGDGPGRLLIGMETAAGGLTWDPCSDPEFVQGASCTARTLSDGSRLVLRDVVDFEGVRTISAVLIHPDRSGFIAESGNWRVPDVAVAPKPIPEDGSRAAVQQREASSLPETTRPDPVYELEDLAALLRGIDDEM
jgi:hypothetical protein